MLGCFWNRLFRVVDDSWKQSKESSRQNDALSFAAEEDTFAGHVVVNLALFYFKRMTHKMFNFSQHFLADVCVPEALNLCYQVC